MSGLGAYKEAAVTTQNKGQLIVLLYEGTIKFLRRAIRNMEEKDYESKSENITRALDIITELNVVLDMEAEKVHAIAKGNAMELLGIRMVDR